MSHIKEVAKMLKSLKQSAFTLRVKRIVRGVIKNDAIYEDFADVYEDFDVPVKPSSVNISFSKNSDTVQIGKDRSASALTLNASSSESSISSTPSNSPRKIIEKAKNLVPSTSGETKMNELSDKKPQPIQTNESTHCFPQHSTVDCSISDFIQMDDTTLFNLDPNHSYLNVNVYGRSIKSDNMLLGFVSIPIINILAECNDFNLYIEKYMLNPPEKPASSHPLSALSGFTPSICYGDINMSFIWNQDISKDVPKGTEENKTQKLSSQNSLDKLDDKMDIVVNRKHNFIPTHFRRSTQCDYCGKKIWLKDAVSCKECAMSCHKKCIVRCQSSTVCSGSESKDDDSQISQNAQPEFKVTSVDGTHDSNDFEVADEAIDSYKLSGHRQSFSDLLAQGIKRVNSANNLNIPTIVSSLAQNSKSLPPTPSRKPSLTTQNVNPFIIVVHRLEQFPKDKKEMTNEETKYLTEPLMSLIGGSLDDLMELAKSSSEFLYADYDVEERVYKINLLVRKSFIIQLTFVTLLT